MNLKAYLLTCIALLVTLANIAQQKININGQYWNIYIAADGDDHNSGSIYAPLRSLEKARNLIRTRKANSGLPKKGVYVWIRKGNYHIKTEFVLSRQDSGTPECPITYSAYPLEQVTLSNATTVGYTQWEPLNELAQQRVHPGVKSGLLRALDVQKLGLKHTKVFSPDDIFSSKWFSIELYANQKRQPISQWPNPNEVLSGESEAGWATCNGSKDSRSFYYASGGKPLDRNYTNEMELDGSNRAKRWHQALEKGHEIWLKGFWRVPWEPFTAKVKSINTLGKYISLLEEPIGGMGSKYSDTVSLSPLFRSGSGKENWSLINSLEEIDQPGEWALDIKDQTIYYYPPSSLNALKIEIADNQFPMIRMEEVEYINILNLKISGSLGNGIESVNGSYNTIAGCQVFNTSNIGVLINSGTHNQLISNNIFETGAAGIRMTNQGSRKNLTSASSQIKNNHIYNIGKMTYMEAIQLENSTGITISHNLLHDLPKSAIRTDLVNDCLFEYNEVHNIALKESDNGAFYNYGGWTTYGNIFRYNFIHHINRSNGFYCDDGDSGDRFMFNIVHDAIEALKFGGGHDNQAFQNIIINSKNQVVDDRGISRNYKLGSPYQHRLLELNPTQEPWRSYGLKLSKSYGLSHMLWTDILKPEWHPEYPNGCIMRNNISINSGPFIKPTHGNVLIKSNLELPEIKSAKFYNYQQMDLRSSNAAILRIFPTLNREFTKIGLYKDQFRKTVPGRRQTGGLSNRTAAGKTYHEDQFVD